MPNHRPSRFSVLITALLAVAFAVWTWLALGTHVLRGWDAATTYRGLPTHSPFTQIMEAVAMVTWPGVEYTCLAVVAWWAYRRRLRRLAVALVTSILVSWWGNAALKLAFQRVRPPSPLDVITMDGWSYPSGHMAGIGTAAVMVIATTTTTRQSPRTILLWRLAGVALVALVAFNRWVMNAHWLSDIVGGLLWGALAAALAMVIAGVHIMPEPAVTLSTTEHLGPRQRCAVIFNPSKVFDVATLRRHVGAELVDRDWDAAVWLETTRDDAGRAMARAAIDANVDLVLVAGGDGTVRVVCSELAHTGIAVGLIPAGTGNLLARNLGVPLDEREALTVAFAGARRRIDLVKLTVDGDASTAEYSAVMAGMGIDAVIMERTNAELKKAVGSAAYFLTAAQYANHPAMHATITVDNRQPFTRNAAVIVIGNVGLLQVNIQLFPDASPTDGLLDIAVASPRSLVEWARIVTRVLARTGKQDRLDRRQGRTVRIECNERVPYQLDGDTAGEARVLEAVVAAQALTIMLPG